MGLKNELLKPFSTETVKYQDFVKFLKKNNLPQIVAIDVSLLMHKYVKVAYSQGKNENWLSNFLGKINALCTNGLKPLFVFDGKPRDHKMSCINNRAEKTKARKDCATEETKEKIHRQTQAVHAHIHLFGKLLEKALGFGYIQIIQVHDAEQVCCDLARKRIVGAVMSRDNDTVLFGAPIVVNPDKNKLEMKTFYDFEGKTSAYRVNVTVSDDFIVSCGIREYLTKKMQGEEKNLIEHVAKLRKDNREMLLKLGREMLASNKMEPKGTYEITINRKHAVKLIVAASDTDFSKKVSGVGPATVLKYFYDIEQDAYAFTDDQQTAIKIFMEDVDYNNVEYVKTELDEPNWFVFKKILDVAAEKKLIEVDDTQKRSDDWSMKFHNTFKCKSPFGDLVSYLSGKKSVPIKFGEAGAYQKINSDFIEKTVGKDIMSL